MQLVDTHCHIHFKDYPIPVSEVLNNAKAADVTRIICVGCTLADSQRAIDFAKDNDNVWVSVGAHPHDGSDYLNDPQASNKLRAMLAMPKVVACGEIGLDYYHEKTSRDDQKNILVDQINAAVEFELPFIFHVRDAFSDFFEIVDKYDIKQAVVHSFSASQIELNEIIKRGFYVGLNGIMTFTKDDKQLQAAKLVPKERLILETDAPFLTPKPDRGKVCEPKHIKNIADFLAELRNESPEELAAYTTENAKKLFGIQ